MNLLVGIGSEDPGTETLRAKLDTGDWMHTRDQNPIAGRTKNLRDASEVGSERERTQPDP